MAVKRFRHGSGGRRGRARGAVLGHADLLEQARWTAYWTREFEDRWAAVERACTDRASRARLARLIERLTGRDRGARESALAELELATLLVRAGFSVGFLPESRSRTPDLHCTLGHSHLLVEVTALVGSLRRRRSLVAWEPANDPGEDDHVSGQVLINRLRARISQKARQLVDAAASVLLAVTVPHRDDRAEALDLRYLSGSVTVMLPESPQVSAVVLSLWDVEPSPARSGVRLANVAVVERSAQQSAYPRVRLLILNPAARHPLSPPVKDALKGLL
jgi:hypothetical protein